MGSLESINDDQNVSIDTIIVNVPLFIRLLEYAKESVKDDVELHVMTERITAICADGKTATMDDYDSIIGKVDEPSDDVPPENINENLDNSNENLRNDTASTITIDMKDIDQANALTKALNEFKNKAGVGGDVEMFISLSDDKHESCGTIGHDVTIGDIAHNIHK